MLYNLSCLMRPVSRLVVLPSVNVELQPLTNAVNVV